MLRLDQRLVTGPRADRLLLTGGLLLCRYKLGHLGRRALWAQMGVFLPHWVSTETWMSAQGCN